MDDGGKLGHVLLSLETVIKLCVPESARGQISEGTVENRETEKQDAHEKVNNADARRFLKPQKPAKIPQETHSMATSRQSILATIHFLFLKKKSLTIFFPWKRAHRCGTKTGEERKKTKNQNSRREERQRRRSPGTCGRYLAPRQNRTAQHSKSKSPPQPWDAALPRRSPPKSKRPVQQAASAALLFSRAAFKTPRASITP